MKNFKSILKRASALVLATATSVVFMAGCGKTTPMETIEKGAEKLRTNITENYSVINTLKDAANGGSVEIKISLAEILEQYAGMKLDLGASLAMFFGENDSAMQLAADFKGVNLVDVIIYETLDGVAVKSDVLTNGVAYGSAFEEIDERYADSEFAEGGAYELPAEVGEVMEYLTLVGSAASMGKDLNALWSGLKPEIYAAVEENSENSVERGTYDVAGTTVKTNNVTIIAEEDQICDVCIAVIDVLLNSKELEKFCDTYSDILTYIIGIEDLYDVMTEVLESAKEEVEDSYGEMEDIKVELYAFVNRSSKELIGLELVGTADDGEEVEIKLTCGPSSEELQEIRLEIDAAGNEAAFLYEVTESSKTNYESKVSVSDYEDNEVTVMKYAWDKESGEYELLIGENDESGITISGQIEAGEKKSTITIESIGNSYINYEFEELAIVINASAKMPAIDSYTDILTMSDDEIAEMIETVTGNLNDIMTTLG